MNDIASWEVVTLCILNLREVEKTKLSGTLLLMYRPDSACKVRYAYPYLTLFASECPDIRDFRGLTIGEIEGMLIDRLNLLIRNTEGVKPEDPQNPGVVPCCAFGVGNVEDHRVDGKLSLTYSCAPGTKSTLAEIDMVLQTSEFEGIDDFRELTVQELEGLLLRRWTDIAHKVPLPLGKVEGDNVDD